RASRVAALFLGAWGLFFALLTLGQRRYGNDFAPAAALLFGFASVAGLERLTQGFRIRAWRVTTAGIASLLLLLAGFWPPLETVYWPRAVSSWMALSGHPGPGLAARTSVAGTLHRFVRDVRGRTPETSGYLAAGSRPEYGIIAHANLGHAIQYGARRPTATDPFWWYIGPENWRRSLEFLSATDEDAALTGAEVLQARFLVTSDEVARNTVAGQLHDRDGVSLGTQPALGHFRLVTESVPGGLGLGAIFRTGPSGGAAYKLFEIVKGARLEVTTDMGSPVEAQVRVRTTQGREFTYRTVARPGPDGVARLTLPYSTTGGPSGSGAEVRTRAMSPYRVRVGPHFRVLRVDEEDVLEGSVLYLEGRQRADMRDP
ncbi:MAG: hypothetical protein VCC04_05245, partial [Myxococcota bacterium]